MATKARLGTLYKSMRNRPLWEAMLLENGERVDVHKPIVLLFRQEQPDTWVAVAFGGLYEVVGGTLPEAFASMRAFLEMSFLDFSRVAPEELGLLAQRKLALLREHFQVRTAAC